MLINLSSLLLLIPKVGPLFFFSPLTQSKGNLFAMLPGALAIRLLGFTAHASFIIAAAAASAPGDQAAEELVHRCGNTHPSKELVDAHEMLEKNKEQHKTRSIDANDVINIDMYMHVVMSHEDKQILANVREAS